MGQLCFQHHWLQRPVFSDFFVKNVGEGANKRHGAGTKDIATMMQTTVLTKTTSSIHSSSDILHTAYDRNTNAYFMSK